MKKLLSILLLIPWLLLGQGNNTASDTLLLKSANGTFFGLYVTDLGELKVVNFGNPQPPVGTPMPSVGFKYSKIVSTAGALNINTPTQGLQLIQERYFDRLDSIGFLAKCDYFYVFVNDGGADFGLINWADPDKFRAVAMQNPSFDSLTGYNAGPNNNGYLNTTYNPSIDAINYTADLASYGGYASGIVSENGFIMGVNSNYDNIFRIKKNTSGTFRLNSSSSTGFSTTTDTATLFIANRNIQNIEVILGSQVVKSAVILSQNGLPSDEMYLLCQNLGGAPNGNSKASLAMAFLAGEIKSMAAPVTQFTEDYLAEVRAYYGLPSMGSSTQQTAALSKEDIMSVNDIIKGYETVIVNSELRIMDLHAMLDTSDVLWGNNGELLGVREAQAEYGWQIRYEHIKAGFKNPVNGIVEWKYPTAIDSLAIWAGFNFMDPYRYFQFYGSNDMAVWEPISEKVNFSYDRKFNYVKSINTSKFRYFKAQRYTTDLNGHNDKVVHHFLKIIPFARQDKFLPYPTYLAIDSLRIRKNTFAQTMGVSAYTVDSLQHVIKFKNISQFNNFKRYMSRPGDPWGTMLNYFSAYSTVYANQIKHVGPDGRPVKMLRGGMEDVYEYWRDHGVDFVLERFQLSTDAWLTDSLNQYYIQSKSRDSSILASNVLYITDNKYSMPDNIRGEPQVWVDTIVLERNLSPYDYRKSIYDAYDSLYYAVGDSSDLDFTDYLSGKFVEKDANGKRTGRVKSIVNFLRIPPEAIIEMADPSKRFDVLTTPENYELWGDFIFNYTAVTGRNKNIPASDLHIIHGDSTLIGLDIVDAQAGENEADRDWEGGLAQMPAYAIGMMLSVQYDGHLGLVDGIRGNHAVGMHTADSTMKMVIHSTINSDMHRSILALKWAEYFRTRDMHLTSGYHPYNGMKLTAQFKNVAFDFHEYISTAGGQGSGTLSTATEDYALTPELSITTTEMLEGLRIIRTLWPQYEVYCSEYGYGHIHGGKFAARKELIGIYDPATETYNMDPDYDLTYAQASNNDWNSMYKHGYLEKIFVYRLKDADNYYARIDTSTTPKSIDRQKVWDTPVYPSSFVSHGLYTHANSTSTPKPAAYSIHTLLDVIGDSYQIDYVKDEQDSVAIFKYYDFADKYWTYAIRRYTNHNGKAYNYTIPIPREVKNVVRIEPVRNGPQLSTTILGDIRSYTTTVTEKYFLLKLEM